MNWTKLLINLAVSFVGGFGAVYGATGDWKQALGGGVLTTLGNQSALHQTPPTPK